MALELLEKNRLEEGGVVESPLMGHTPEPVPPFEAQPPTTSPMGALQDLIMGIPHGIAQTFTGAGKMLQAFAGAPPQIEEVEPTSLPGEYGRGLGSALAPLSLMAAGAALGTGVAAPALIGLGIMGLAEAWDAYQRELARQQEEEGRFDKEKALRKAALYGAGSTALELGVGRVGRFVGVDLSDALYRTSRKFTGSAAMARLATDIGSSVAENMAEEASQRALQDIIVEGKLTPGIVEEGIMGGLIGPPTLMLGRAGVRGAQRLRAAITGREPTTTVEELLRAAGIESAHASAAAEWMHRASDVLADANKILPSIATQTDLEPYLTDRNRNAIATGKQPDPFAEQNKPDGAALIWNVYDALTQSGLILPNVRLNDQQRAMISRAAESYAILSAADHISSRYGGDVAKKVLETLQAIYENKDIETSQVPPVTGKPADQRAERAIEARTEERRGPRYQAPTRPKATEQTQRSARQEIFAAIRPEDLRERVGKLLAVARKRFDIQREAQTQTPEEKQEASATQKPLVEAGQPPERLLIAAPEPATEAAPTAISQQEIKPEREEETTVQTTAPAVAEQKPPATEQPPLAGKETADDSIMRKLRERLDAIWWPLQSDLRAFARIQKDTAIWWSERKRIQDEIRRHIASLDAELGPGAARQLVLNLLRAQAKLGIDLFPSSSPIIQKHLSSKELKEFKDTGRLPEPSIEYPAYTDEERRKLLAQGAPRPKPEITRETPGPTEQPQPLEAGRPAPQPPVATEEVARETTTPAPAAAAEEQEQPARQGVAEQRAVEAAEPVQRHAVEMPETEQAVQKAQVSTVLLQPRATEQPYGVLTPPIDVVSSCPLFDLFHKTYVYKSKAKPNIVGITIPPRDFLEFARKLGYGKSLPDSLADVVRIQAGFANVVFDFYHNFLRLYEDTNKPFQWPGNIDRIVRELCGPGPKVLPVIVGVRLERIIHGKDIINDNLKRVVDDIIDARHGIAVSPNGDIYDYHSQAAVFDKDLATFILTTCERLLGKEHDLNPRIQDDVIFEKINSYIKEKPLEPISFVGPLAASADNAFLVFSSGDRLISVNAAYLIALLKKYPQAKLYAAKNMLLASDVVYMPANGIDGVVAALEDGTVLGLFLNNRSVSRLPDKNVPIVPIDITIAEYRAPDGRVYRFPNWLKNPDYLLTYAPYYIDAAMAALQTTQQFAVEAGSWWQDRVASFMVGAVPWLLYDKRVTDIAATNTSKNLVEFLDETFTVLHVPPHLFQSQLFIPRNAGLWAVWTKEFWGQSQTEKDKLYLNVIKKYPIPNKHKQMLYLPGMTKEALDRLTSGQAYVNYMLPSGESLALTSFLIHKQHGIYVHPYGVILDKRLAKKMADALVKKFPGVTSTDPGPFQKTANNTYQTVQGWINTIKSKGTLEPDELVPSALTLHVPFPHFKGENIIKFVSLSNGKQVFHLAAPIFAMLKNIKPHYKLMIISEAAKAQFGNIRIVAVLDRETNELLAFFVPAALTLDPLSTIIEPREGEHISDAIARAYAAASDLEILKSALGNDVFAILEAYNRGIIHYGLIDIYKEYQRHATGKDIAELPADKRRKRIIKPHALASPIDINAVVVATQEAQQEAPEQAPQEAPTGPTPSKTPEAETETAPEPTPTEIEASEPQLPVAESVSEQPAKPQVEPAVPVTQEPPAQPIITSPLQRPAEYSDWLRDLGQKLLLPYYQRELRDLEFDDSGRLTNRGLEALKTMVGDERGRALGLIKDVGYDIELASRVAKHSILAALLQPYSVFTDDAIVSPTSPVARLWDILQSGAYNDVLNKFFAEFRTLVNLLVDGRWWDAKHNPLAYISAALLLRREYDLSEQMPADMRPARDPFAVSEAVESLSRQGGVGLATLRASYITRELAKNIDLLPQLIKATIDAANKAYQRIHLEDASPIELRGAERAFYVDGLLPIWDDVIRLAGRTPLERGNLIYAAVEDGVEGPTAGGAMPLPESELFEVKDVDEFIGLVEQMPNGFELAVALRAAKRMGLFELLPGLKFAIGKMPDGRILAYYDTARNVIAYTLRGFDQPWKLTSHEFLHALFEALPDEDRALVRRLRLQAIQQWMRTRALSDKRSGLKWLVLAALSTGVEPALRGRLNVPADVYHLSSDSEFFVWMLEGRLERALRGLALTHLEQNLLQRWWNRITDIIQKVIAWAKDLLARIRPGYDPELRDAVNRFWDKIARGEISPNHSAVRKPPGEPTVYFAVAQDDPVEPYLSAVRSREAEDVEAARRYATAYIRGALEQIAGAFNELKKEWDFDKSERKELQGQRQTNANLTALIGDIDRVIDLERFRERTGLDFYEPAGFAKLVEEVNDLASRNPVQAGPALRALQNLRSEFYNWSAYLYARDLAEVLIKRDAAARQLAYYRLLRENREIADPGQTELIAKIQPEFDVALPDLETRITELEAELQRLQQEVADSERELDNFISRHAAGMSRMALENERWPLLDIYNRLRESKLVEEQAGQQYSPDLFARLFRMRVEQLVQIALTRDTYAYKYRVLQKLLLDDHLKAFARGDYRVAEIGLPDLAEITNRALEAIYNPAETQTEDQRRVIATSFVHAVLKFNAARDRAFQEYQQVVRRLSALVEWNALRLLASEKLRVVTDRLWKILDSEQWPSDTIGFSKAEVVHGLLRFATMVVQKIRQVSKESRASDVMRFFKALRLGAAAIAATPMSLSNKADAYKQLIADAFVEAVEAPRRLELQKKDIGRIVGLSDPMLAVVMDLIVSNPSIARLITGFASVLVRPEYEAFAKTVLKRIVQVGSYLKKRQKLKTSKKGKDEQGAKQEAVGRLDEGEIVLLRAHIETVLSWIEYEVDPQITALRRELIEAKAELDATRLAMSIWDGLTRRDFPKRDGSGDTPFWTVWHDALAISGLSRVMAFVGPEEHRAGTGTVVFLGFDMPEKDPETGNTRIVHIPEVVISPSMPNPSDVIQEELRRWVEAATMYVINARSAEARYRQYLEQIRGLTEEELKSKIEAGEIVEVQSPEALGYDITIANGLQNALLTHAMYFGGNVPLDFMGQPEHESSLLRLISSTRFTHTLEQLASWIPQPYRSSVRVWMARWANMRLTTGRIYNDYLPKILDAKLRAMRAFGTTSEYEYRQLVWAPLTEYARQHGVRVEVGIKLRTGHVISKEDIELLRLVYHFERELLHAAQKIHGHDPNLGVADAVVGTMFTVGGVKYARYAASVGTYGLPRHINTAGYMLIDKLAVAYARLADDPAAEDAYRALLTKGIKAFEDRPVSYQHDLDNPPVFELLMEPWFAAAADGAAESYLIDSLRHKSDIAIERDDVWLRVLRRAAELFLEERKAERKQVVHGVVLQPAPVQWSDVIDYIARATIELRAIEDAESRARAYAQYNVFRDLDAMARYAMAAVDAERFREMAVKAAETPGRTFLNEFTKPAGTLWLPSALYSYGALTEGEMQMSAVRAQAYTFVEFMLAVRRARRHLEESAKAVATAPAAYPADLNLLRKTLSLVRALEEALVSLASLAWTGRMAKDPLFLSLVKSTLLSNIVVTLRNLTLGPILAWIHNAQLLNVSRALTSLLTLKQAVKAAAGFVVDLATSGARIVTKTFGILPALVKSMGGRQKLRELLESYLDNIANAAITDTVRSVSNTGFSLSRKTVQLAYFTWLFHKVHRFIYDEILWVRPGLAGMAHRVGRKVRAGATAAAQILRAIGTELADTYLNAMALDSAVAIERHLEEIAENVYNRLKVQGVLGDLLETIVPAIVHPTSPFALRPEDISARRTEAERAEHAAELRQLFNEAGMNLDTLILGIVKKMAEHEQARMRESQGQIMPASPKVEIPVLSEQQRIDLMRALMRRFNQGDIINRPIVAIFDTTRRTILTFMGYSINFLHQLIGFIAGKPGVRWPDKLLLMLWKLLWLALIVLLFGQISIKTTNEVKQFVFNEPPTVPTLFDADFYKNWTLARRSLFFSLLLGLPLVGDLIARAAGVVFGNRGWSLTDRVLAIRLVDDFVALVFNTSRNLVSAVTSERPISSRARDVVEPAFQALMRYVWFATPFIRGVSETKDVAADLRQARNLARYYSLLSGVATEQKQRTPSPASTVGTDVIRQRILNDIAAAASRRDPGAFQSALEELVTYFKERGSEDPARSAQAALQSLNPFYKVADDRTPDEAEITKILSSMPGAYRERLTKPYADFLWAKGEAARVLRRPEGGAGAIGQPFRGVGRARSVSIRAPSIRSRVGRIKIPTPSRLAGSALAESTLGVLQRPSPPPVRSTRRAGAWGLRRPRALGVPGLQSVGRVPKIRLGRGIAIEPGAPRVVPAIGRAAAAQRRRKPAPLAAQALRVPIGKA